MDEWANDPTFCDMAQLMGVELDSMDFEQVKQLFDSWDHGRHTLHGPKLEEESLLFGYFISPKINTPRDGKPYATYCTENRPNSESWDYNQSPTGI